jgi:hypothetical protein
VWSGPQRLDAKKWTDLQNENPAELSKCTPGGVVMSIRADASDLDLTTLPMTDALRSSAMVEFTSADATKPHDLVVTVKGANDSGKTEYKQVHY